MEHGPRSVVLWGSFLMTAVLLGPAPRAVGSDEAAEAGLSTGAGLPASAVRIPEANTAQAVHAALRGAAARLTRPGCQRILGDFRDRRGRSLGTGAGDSAAGFLSQLLFYDGSGTLACGRRRGRVLAFTRPSSRVIYICGQAFTSAHPYEAEATLIHEMLHAAGLDHEAGGVITETVVRRCGK